MWTVDVIYFIFFYIIQNSLQSLTWLSHSDNYISKGSDSHINCFVRSSFQAILINNDLSIGCEDCPQPPCNAIQRNSFVWLYNNIKNLFSPRNC